MFGRSKKGCITGDPKTMKIRAGHNKENGKYYIQMTEILHDRKGNRYAGQEMKINLEEEHFKNFAGLMLKTIGFTNADSDDSSSNQQT